MERVTWLHEPNDLEVFIKVEEHAEETEQHRRLCDLRMKSDAAKYRRDQEGEDEDKMLRVGVTTLRLPHLHKTKGSDPAAEDS
jgi:hypothetical protein